MSATLNRWKFTLAELNDRIDTLQTIPYHPSLDPLLECSIDQCTAVLATIDRIRNIGQRLPAHNDGNGPTEPTGSTCH